MSDERPLCHRDDIPDGQSRGFPGVPGSFIGLFAVRQGEAVQVYVNSCPHVGVPLEIVPDRFLDGPGRHIVCAVHGARFRIEDGFCLSGPCAGDALEAVPARIDAAGMVWVPADAGS
ncbi:Rieske 2Fe-2S domain-containing protein [Roseomonas sp. GC11]|uniref:Rieske (2Fe-2S) protein n=1 Tax=Roseomonas sp. GC11 TaxID=2950546 RepID=UPI0021093D8E|nr:Rieske 2Fe-2S domain-containing protein [Roseomonas sp. GC11]MCQ4160935.1 Rieske 2Fe-2S domain-containing protein [Roseomonas sp. GC11]